MRRTGNGQHIKQCLAGIGIGKSTGEIAGRKMQRGVLNRGLGDGGNGRKLIRGDGQRTGDHRIRPIHATISLGPHAQRDQLQNAHPAHIQIDRHRRQNAGPRARVIGLYSIQPHLKINRTGIVGIKTRDRLKRRILAFQRKVHFRTRLRPHALRISHAIDGHVISVHVGIQTDGVVVRGAGALEKCPIAEIARNSQHRQIGLITDHAAHAVGHDAAERRAIIPGNRQAGVRGGISAGNCHAIARPLIIQRTRAGRIDREGRDASDIHTLIDGFIGDRRSAGRGRSQRDQRCGAGRKAHGIRAVKCAQILARP